MPNDPALTETPPRYLADRFDWAAPGDHQRDVWMIRFNDQERGDVIFDAETYDDPEAAAWEAWDRYAPAWNCYVFRLARLRPDRSAPTSSLRSPPMDKSLDALVADGLKPCPFCGEEALLAAPKRNGDAYDPTGEVQCCGCGAYGPFRDAAGQRADACERWNTRAAEQSTPAGMVDEGATRDAIDDLLRPLHRAAWEAGVFTSQEEWPDCDEQDDLMRSVDSVAVGEHYQAWGEEAREKLFTLISAAPDPAKPVSTRVTEERKKLVQDLAHIDRKGGLGYEAHDTIRRAVDFLNTLSTEKQDG